MKVLYCKVFYLTIFFEVLDLALIPIPWRVWSCTIQNHNEMED